MSWGGCVWTNERRQFNLMEKRKDRRKQARRETASQMGDVRPQENVFDPFMSASTVQQPRVCFFEESSSGFILLHKPWEESDLSRVCPQGAASDGNTWLTHKRNHRPSPRTTSKQHWLWRGRERKPTIRRIFSSRKGAPVQQRQRHGERGGSFLLKRSKNPQEGDDQNTEGLSHAKDQRLQGDHPLPRSLVHACDGSTFTRRKREKKRHFTWEYRKSLRFSD